MGAGRPLWGLAAGGSPAGTTLAAEKLQARAAAIAERDRASPDPLQAAGCDDLSDAEAAAARGRAVAGGTATHADGAPNPWGVAAA